MATEFPNGWSEEDELCGDELCGDGYDGEEIFTLQDFKQEVKSGNFNEYDGGGVAAKEVDGVLERSDLRVDLSDLGKVPEGTTHVIWFNK